jgi:hypothetical protein
MWLRSSIVTCGDRCHSERAKRGGICCNLSLCMRRGYGAGTENFARGFNRSLASLRDDRRARDRCHSERAKRGGICCNLSPCMPRGYGARTGISARGFNRSLAALRDDRRVVCARSLSFRTREARRNLLQPHAVHVAKEQRENGDCREGVQQVPRFASGRQARCVWETLSFRTRERGGICCNVWRCMWRGYGAGTGISARGFNRSLASLRDDRRVVCGRRCHSERAKRGGICCNVSEMLAEKVQRGN